MRTRVHISTFGAAALLLLATGPAVAEEDPGVLTVYPYPIEAVQRAAADALTDIGCEIKENRGGHLEGVRPHKLHMISSGSGGERVIVTLAPASEGVTSVDIRTKKTFVGYVQQVNWDEAVRNGIRQHVLAPAANSTAPPPAVASKPKKDVPAQSNRAVASSQSPARPTASGSDIASGLAALAVFASEVFLASKGYDVAPTPMLVAAPVSVSSPSPAPVAILQSPIMCPDGSFVNRPPCTLCPNGRYVGGSSTCNPTQLAPDGTLHPTGPLTLCPDGTYVTGTACILAPNGHYVGN